MSSTRFTADHEWVRSEGSDTVTVGITEFAQGQLGDLVYVELPEPGRMLARGEEAAVIESVKAAGDIKSPLAGTVVQVNPAIVEDPTLVNRDPEGAGWFFTLRPADADALSGLLDETAYRALVDSA